jgi:hypothetical protein
MLSYGQASAASAGLADRNRLRDAATLNVRASLIP